MSKRFVLFYFFFALASCTKSESTPTSGSPSLTQGGGGAASAGAAGAPSQPAASNQQSNAGSSGKGTSGPSSPIVMVSATSAKTDQPSTPSQPIKFSPQYNADFRWEPLLTPTVYFVDDHGNKVGLSSDLMLKPGSNGWPEGQLTPASPLEIDRWYSLKVEPKGYYLQGTVDEETLSMETKPLELRLFTGSAPFLQRATINDAGDHLKMYFSEEIDLSKVQDNVNVWSEGIQLKGCVTNGNDCLSSDVTSYTVGQGFGYVLKDRPASTIEIKFNAATKGRTRTFGEAAALFGLPTDASGHVTYQITWAKSDQGTPVWVHPRVETTAR